jgi:hypothetical protein
MEWYCLILDDYVPDETTPQLTIKMEADLKVISSERKTANNLFQG